MTKNAFSVHAGSIYAMLGTATCVLGSICYHGVNEINYPGVDAGFSATARHRSAIFFAGPCSLYFTWWLRVTASLAVEVVKVVKSSFFVCVRSCLSSCGCLGAEFRVGGHVRVGFCVGGHARWLTGWIRSK